MKKRCPLPALVSIAFQFIHSQTVGVNQFYVTGSFSGDIATGTTPLTSSGQRDSFIALPDKQYTITRAIKLGMEHKKHPHSIGYSNHMFY